MSNDNPDSSVENLSDDESTIVEVPIGSRVETAENAIRNIRDGFDQLNKVEADLQNIQSDYDGLQARVGIIEKKIEKKPPPIRQGLVSLLIVFQCIDGLLSGGKDVNVIAKAIGISSKYLKIILESRSCGRVCHQKLDFWFHPLKLKTQLIGFEGQTGQRGQRLINLENKSVDRVVFKMLTDDPQAFRCHPPFGYVEAKSSAQVVVERMMDGRSHKNKIDVRAIGNEPQAWVNWAGADVIEILHVAAFTK